MWNAASSSAVQNIVCLSWSVKLQLVLTHLREFNLNLLFNPVSMSWMSWIPGVHSSHGFSFGFPDCPSNTCAGLKKKILSVNSLLPPYFLTKKKNHGCGGKKLKKSMKIFQKLTQKWNSSKKPLPNQIFTNFGLILGSQNGLKITKNGKKSKPKKWQKNRRQKNRKKTEKRL